MSLTYVVTSNAPRVIDGLGVFVADETKTISETEEGFFSALRGVRLNQHAVPEGVKVVIVVQAEGEEN